MSLCGERNHEYVCRISNMSPVQASLDRLLERAAGQCLNQTGGMKLTHWTPHPPALITAGIKDDEVLFDIFIGGKFKGV